MLNLLKSSRIAASLLGCAVLATAVDGVRPVLADNTGGVDSALFRQSYDTTGVYFLDGARLMPKREFSWKVLLSYAQSPIDVAVPGIGPTAGDTGSDSILRSLTVVDMAFGMTLSKRIAIGWNVAAYRTSTAEGYGTRARYSSAGPVGQSTGLIALRPLSNIDPSGGFINDGLAGPLDVRFAGKFSLWNTAKTALSLVATTSLPFGEDQMLLGDASFVFEPKLTFDHYLQANSKTRIVANVGARFRRRTVLEGFDTQDSMQAPTTSQAFLDVGSEMIVGAGAVFQATPRAMIGVEAVGFLPLPERASFGTCYRFSGDRCSGMQGTDYFGKSKRGDTTVLANLGLNLRLSASTSAQVMFGLGALGARGDDLRISTGFVWSPQPVGAVEVGGSDRDEDGIADSIDACQEDSEDKDGYQDNDGCPDPDNDGDGINDKQDGCIDQPEDRDAFKDDDGCPEDDNDSDGISDSIDRCPDAKEDSDGFSDDDGCPDEDNDGDGFADAVDKCPNDQETVNGVTDDDGCPESKIATGPSDTGDRIDLKGAQISFKGNVLTPAAKQTLNGVASIVRNGKLTIRIEVHVARSTKLTTPAALKIAAKKDKELSLRRALQVMDYLVSQGVSNNQLQAAGIGSDRPLGSGAPSDAINDRVDFIKAQQKAPGAP